MKNRFFRTVFVASMVLTLGLTGCQMDKEDPTLGVSPAGTLSFTAAGESKSLAVTSNTDWSVSASEGWLTVTPTSGKGNASVSVTAQAQAQTATAVRNAELTFSAKDATSVKISVTQAAAGLTTVNLAAVAGVVQPVTGALPVSAITAGEQYTGTVAWSPSVTGAFATSTTYTATITLTAKAGYTFEGVAENFFTVENATATNAAGSGVIMAVFPATAAPSITITTQPTAAISVTEGAISASISVTASATGGATPGYQWYSNTENSNVGGTATTSISSSLFWLPSNLTAAGSPYYYFCEVSAAGAEPVRTYVTTVTVTPNTLATEKSWYDTNPDAATFSIGSAAGLAYLAQLVNSETTNFNGKTINLTDNIDLAGLNGDWIPIGANGEFYGTFDGKGKTISNLRITGGDSNLGLFATISSRATVKNVTLADVNITGYAAIGGIVGTSSGTVENCSVSGSISGTGNSIGGVAGYIGGGTVRNCHSSANVTLTGDGHDVAGGIAGYNGHGSMVEYCYATGSVTHNATSGGGVGGIVGTNYNSTVRYCVALNYCVSIANTTTTIGRVVGANSGTMSNNYASTGMIITGSGYTPDAGTDKKDGTDITAAQWNSASWWSGTAGFNSFENVWTLANDKLPVLK